MDDFSRGVLWCAGQLDIAAAALSELKKDGAATALATSAEEFRNEAEKLQAKQAAMLARLPKAEPATWRGARP